MFKVNLEKELISSKKASLSKDEQVVLAEAEKILNNSTEEDMSILKKMGLNYSVEKSKNLENKIKFIKAFDKTRVFSENEIKDLCTTYGLRFLPIDKYRGEIDPLVPSKVKEFEAIHKTVVGATTWKNEFRYDRFKICAPKESFKLSERPMDPLLFYPIGNNANSDESGRDYFLVHKWGTDISAWNAVKSWRNKNFGTWFTYLYILYILPLTGISSLIFNWNLGFLGIAGLSLTISLLISFINAVADGGSFFDGRWSEDNWDSEFKN